MHHASLGHRVTFICDEQAVDEELPKLHSKFKATHPNNARTLQQVDIKYCSDFLELTQYFSHVQLYEAGQVPHVVIVHDIVRYLELSLFLFQEDEGATERKQGSDDQFESAMGSHRAEAKAPEFEDDGHSDFVDGDGKLEYAIKLAQLLPIVESTRKCAQRRLQNETQRGDAQQSGFLQEMICIVGMECADDELLHLAPFWRRSNFRRFLRCTFCAASKVVAVRFEAGAESNDPKKDKVREQDKASPTVYCYVGEQTLDMMMVRNAKK